MVLRDEPRLYVILSRHGRPEPLSVVQKLRRCFTPMHVGNVHFLRRSMCPPSGRHLAFHTLERVKALLRAFQNRSFDWTKFTPTPVEVHLDVDSPYQQPSHCSRACAIENAQSPKSERHDSKQHKGEESVNNRSKRKVCPVTSCKRTSGSWCHDTRMVSCPLTAYTPFLLYFASRTHCCNNRESDDNDDLCRAPYPCVSNQG